MVKTVLAIVLALFLFAGCTSPYANEAKALTAAYQKGEISTNDYYSRMNELQALDLQWHQNLSHNMANAGAALQRQGAIMQMNQPQTIYLYNMNH